MVPQLLFLFLGIVGLWIGAGLVVNASIKIAKSLNISQAFIGLTVLSIGTSLPEIFTHIFASIGILKGIEASGIAVGTNIGSNIIQITFVIGILGLLATIKYDKHVMKLDYAMMLGGIVVLFLFSLNGFISRLEGAILAAAYIVYLYLLGKEEKIIEKHPFHTNYLIDGVLIIIGFVLLGYGAQLVIDNAVKLMDLWNVTGSFIGTVVIGVPTSNPFYYFNSFVNLSSKMINSFCHVCLIDVIWSNSYLQQPLHQLLHNFRVIVHTF